MKITFLSAPLNASGGIKVLLTYAKQLSELGHDVTIISPPPWAKPTLADRAKAIIKGNGWIHHYGVVAPEGVKHIELEASRPILDQDVPVSDAVVATWWETAEWVAALPDAKGRKYYFIQGHEIFPPIPERSRDTYKLPLKKIVISKWLKEIMANEYGELDVTVVPNSIDRLQYYTLERDKQKTPTLGFLYSPEYPKGLDVALRTIERVRQQIPELKVLSFGRHPVRRSMPLPPNSKFVRSPSQRRLHQLYCSCDAWLATSKTEGFNLTALEAMASRTPVVSTNVGWPAEGIYNGVNGYLCEVDNDGELSEALLKVLTLPNKFWRFMSKGAYLTMTTSSWTESARLFESVLTGNSEDGHFR